MKKPTEVSVPSLLAGLASIVAARRGPQVGWHREATCRRSWQPFQRNWRQHQPSSAGW